MTDSFTPVDASLASADEAVGPADVPRRLTQLEAFQAEFRAHLAALQASNQAFQLEVLTRLDRLSVPSLTSITSGSSQPPPPPVPAPVEVSPTVSGSGVVPSAALAETTRLIENESELEAIEAGFTINWALPENVGARVYEDIANVNVILISIKTEQNKRREPIESSMEQIRLRLQNLITSIPSSQRRNGSITLWIKFRVRYANISQ